MFLSGVPSLLASCPVLIPAPFDVLIAEKLAARRSSSAPFLPFTSSLPLPPLLPPAPDLFPRPSYPVIIRLSPPRYCTSEPEGSLSSVFPSLREKTN